MPCLRYMRMFLNLVMLLSVTLFVHAQDTTGLKRPAYTLQVAVDKKSYYEKNIKSTPYILPDTTIQLYPGETVYIEVNEENEVIKKMIPAHVSPTPYFIAMEYKGLSNCIMKIYVTDSLIMGAKVNGYITCYIGNTVPMKYVREPEAYVKKKLDSYDELLTDESAFLKKIDIISSSGGQT